MRVPGTTKGATRLRSRPPRIPIPIQISDLTPVPAFLFRTLHWSKFRIRHSSRHSHLLSHLASEVKEKLAPLQRSRPATPLPSTLRSSTPSSGSHLPPAPTGIPLRSTG